MEVPTNPTRQSAFVWIFGSFFISANEIRVSREGFFCTGTETHGYAIDDERTCVYAYTQPQRKQRKCNIYRHT